MSCVTCALRQHKGIVLITLLSFRIGINITIEKCPGKILRTLPLTISYRSSDSIQAPEKHLTDQD